jgi:hypothetical protein
MQDRPRFWRWRKTQDDDIDRELDVHLALETEEQLEAGASPIDAKLAAHRAFGSIALTKEELSGSLKARKLMVRRERTDLLVPQ